MKEKLFRIFKILTIVLTLIIISTNITHAENKNPNRVPKTHTPIKVVPLAEVLKKGHIDVFGYAPSNKRLAVAWSQVAIENGQGRLTYNYNLGNISTLKKVPYYIIAGHPFRSFPNFAEGSRAYWSVIRNMCKSSLPAFDAGAPEWAARILYGCGYYGADPIQYGKAMRQLYSKATYKVIPKLKKSK